MAKAKASVESTPTTKTTVAETPVKEPKVRISAAQRELDAKAFYERAKTAAAAGQTRKEFAKVEGKLSNSVADALMGIYETFDLPVVRFAAEKQPRARSEKDPENVVAIRLYTGGHIKEENRYPYAVVPVTAINAIDGQPGDKLEFAGLTMDGLLAYLNDDSIPGDAQFIVARLIIVDEEPVGDSDIPDAV